MTWHAKYEVSLICRTYTWWPCRAMDSWQIANYRKTLVSTSTWSSLWRFLNYAIFLSGYPAIPKVYLGDRQVRRYQSSRCIPCAARCMLRHMECACYLLAGSFQPAARLSLSHSQLARCSQFQRDDCDLFRGFGLDRRFSMARGRIISTGLCTKKNEVERSHRYQNDKHKRVGCKNKSGLQSRMFLFNWRVRAKQGVRDCA